MIASNDRICVNIPLTHLSLPKLQDFRNKIQRAEFKCTTNFTVPSLVRFVPLFLQDDARKNIAGSTRRKNEGRRGLIDDNRASEMPEGGEGPG